MKRGRSPSFQALHPFDLTLNMGGIYGMQGSLDSPNNNTPIVYALQKGYPLKQTETLDDDFSKAEQT